MTWLHPGHPLPLSMREAQTRREWLIGAAAFVCLTACGGNGRVVRSQTKPKQVGYLAAGRPGGPNTGAFEQGLRDLGWVDGENVAIQYKWSTGGEGDLASLAAELLDLKVEVIVATALPAVRAAIDATRTTPIVMTVIGDPVREGLVERINSPGGNVTGVSNIAPQLSGKRLQLLKEAVPSISLVAVLHNPSVSDMRQGWEETELAAPDLGVQLISLPIFSQPDLSTAFGQAERQGAEALLVLSDDVVFLNRDEIMQRAIAARLPTMGSERRYAVSGALLAYGPDYGELFRRAAAMVDKILRGIRPADIPVERPRKFDFTVNLKTADALGLTLPRSTLLAATEAIQ